MRQNRVHLMPPMSNFYARICVKATPSSNSHDEQFFAVSRAPLRLIDQVAAEIIQRLYGNVVECVMQK